MVGPSAENTSAAKTPFEHGERQLGIRAVEPD